MVIGLCFSSMCHCSWLCLYIFARFCLPVEHLENDSYYLDSLLVGGVWLGLGPDSIVVALGQCVGCGYYPWEDTFRLVVQACA